MKKIALEEHFSGPGFEQYLAGVGGLFDPGAEQIEVAQMIGQVLAVQDQIRRRDPAGYRH